MSPKGWFHLQNNESRRPFKTCFEIYVALTIEDKCIPEIRGFSIHFETFVKGLLPFFVK